MSAVPSFDTLKLAQALQAGGFSVQQAEATAHALADATATSTADVATKSDLTATKTELKTEIAAVRTELKTEIAAVRTELKTEVERLLTKIELSEKNVTIRFGGMLVVAVGVLMAAIRYLPAH
jgi:hypothetical protein